MQLRPYQEECLEAITQAGNGRWLCVLATGLGKTIIISRIPRYGRTLLLAHREELLTQPRKYFDCSYGIEMGSSHYQGEDVCAASVQSMTRRLNKFKPDEFEMIIVDEAHHSSSSSYRKILDYFTGAKRVIGFTATPNRADGVGLEGQYDKIIFNRDIRFGIENGWLSPIECHRVKLDYDLSALAVRMGDYTASDLDKVMNTEKHTLAIKDIIESGKVDFPCLIFACTISHAHNIANSLANAVALDASSTNRAEVLSKFKSGEIKVLVNCALFTEGTDLPLVKSVIIARPTCSHALYSQMVGRGLRLADGKDKCKLFDLVGASNTPICYAPTLLGIEPSIIPVTEQSKLVGDLLCDIPEVAERAINTPDAWVNNVKMVNLFSRRMGVNTHKVAYILTADRRYILDLSFVHIEVSAPDNVGISSFHNKHTREFFFAPAQECFDYAFRFLRSKFGMEKKLWDLSTAMRGWGKYPITEKQLHYIESLCIAKKVQIPYRIKRELTQFSASQIISRLKNYA